MADPIDIVLIRHGESESNVSGRWQGQGDSPLSPRGREQAEALAARLAGESADVLLASDLQRARDTGAAVAARLGATLTTAKEWREIDVGRWEGLTRDEVAERFPEEIARLGRGEMVPIGGGESWADLAVRAEKALQALRRDLAPGQRAFVFCHGGVIAALLTRLFALPLRRPRRLGNVTNTGVTTLRFEGETPRLLQYNDTLHLGPVGKWGEERRQAGAAVLALMADEQAPAGYTPTEQAYTLGRDEGAHHDDPLEAIGELARRHGGERVTLRGEGDALRELVHRILARPVTVGPAGVTHVVASERGHALADFNCADLPPRG